MTGITHRWTEQLLALTDPVDEVLAGLVAEDIVDELWNGSAGSELGWPDLLARMSDESTQIVKFVDELAGFTDVVIVAEPAMAAFIRVLMDRADSISRGHAVSAGAVAVAAGYTVHLADSAHPDVAKRLAENCPTETTLVIPIVSKAPTVDVLAMLSFFWDRNSDGSCFAAVAPAGSLVAELARDRMFRQVFVSGSAPLGEAWVPGDPVEVGGKFLAAEFEALSTPGLVPAVLLGLDTMLMAEAADETAGMLQATGGPAANLGLRLGSVLAASLKNGRNLLTLVPDVEHQEFARWVSSLMAQTLAPAGLITVVDEPEADTSVAGTHRLFVGSNSGAGLNRVVGEGHPAVAHEVHGPGSIAAQVMTWQFAAAVAMQALDLWPEPNDDVADASGTANVDAFDTSGSTVSDTTGVVSIPGVSELLGEGDALGIPDTFDADISDIGSSFEVSDTDVVEDSSDTVDVGAADAKGKAPGASQAVGETDLDGALKLVEPGSHLALHAYIDPDGAAVGQMAELRLALQDQLGVITTLHFSPHVQSRQSTAADVDPGGVMVVQVMDADIGVSEAGAVAVPGLEATFAELVTRQADAHFHELEAKGITVARIRRPL